MVGVAEGANGSDHRLSADQIKGMFAKAAKDHLARLERVAQADRLQPGFSVDDGRRTDLTMGHVYRLLAGGGPEVTVTEATRASLLEAGLSEGEVAWVTFMLDTLRRNKMARDGRPKLEALLASVGGVPSPINLGLAQTTKHRAMAAALFDTRERWDGAFADDAALLAALRRPYRGPLPDISISSRQSAARHRSSNQRSSSRLSRCRRSARPPLVASTRCTRFPAFV